MSDTITARTDFDAPSARRTEGVQVPASAGEKSTEAAMSSLKSGKYQPAFDVMNIAACIAVVILHVNGAV